MISMFLHQFRGDIRMIPRRTHIALLIGALLLFTDVSSITRAAENRAS
jgi:hypothetical protein